MLSPTLQSSELLLLWQIHQNTWQACNSHVKKSVFCISGFWILEKTFFFMAGHSDLFAWGFVEAAALLRGLKRITRLVTYLSLSQHVSVPDSYSISCWDPTHIDTNNSTVQQLMLLLLLLCRSARLLTRYFNIQHLNNQQIRLNSVTQHLKIKSVI